MPDIRDPNYTPTLSEALADPAGFVAGMSVSEQQHTAATSPPAAPRFPLGMACRIERYAGLLEAGKVYAGKHLSKWHPRECKIEGMRLEPTVSEEWDDGSDEPRRVVSYPRGWEYLVVTLTGTVWGWESEAEFVRMGYAV